MTEKTRGIRSACTLPAVAFGLTALLGGCGGHSSPSPGTPVITLADTSGEFASYRVTLGSITFTRSDGTLVTPLITAESADLASLTDVAELLEAPAVPSGTYKSATLTLEYLNAGIWVNLNGQAVAANPVNSAGNALGTQTLTITFDPNNQLVINPGKSTRVAVDIDLAASNSIDTSTTPPKVTVRPFPVITPAAADATLVRARGILVTVQSGSSDYVINLRPLTDRVSALGALTVGTDAQTYFNVNGVAYTGVAGLGALASLPLNTAIAAYGTLGDLSGITPGFHASAVYAGTSLEDPLADHVSGVVSARSGTALTVHGATYVSRSGAVTFANNATVNLGSGTLVSEDGVAVSGLTPQSVSVGQQIDVSGQGSFDSSGHATLDATAGQVRLASTRLWGMLNSATPGSASVDVLTLGNFAPTGLSFAGTGVPGQDANPAAYVLNTGTLDESGTAAHTLLKVEGIVSPFGSAPPDFTATAITAGSATEQRLVIEWINGGASAPFLSSGSAGLVVNLNDSALGTGSIHEIRTGPASLDLKSLPSMPASPLITTVGADQSRLQLAIGKAGLSSGISVFNSVSGFDSALTSTFNGSNKIYRLVAVGQYNGAANTFVASRISVALE